jgi:hypothetical protein
MNSNSNIGTRLASHQQVIRRSREGPAPSLASTVIRGNLQLWTAIGQDPDIPDVVVIPKILTRLRNRGYHSGDLDAVCSHDGIIDGCRGDWSVWFQPRRQGVED